MKTPIPLSILGEPLSELPRVLHEIYNNYSTLKGAYFEFGFCDKTEGRDGGHSVAIRVNPLICFEPGTLDYSTNHPSCLSFNNIEELVEFMVTRTALSYPGEFRNFSVNLVEEIKDEKFVKNRHLISLIDRQKSVKLQIERLRSSLQVLIDRDSVQLQHLLKQRETIHQSLFPLLKWKIEQLLVNRSDQQDGLCVLYVPSR